MKRAVVDWHSEDRRFADELIQRYGLTDRQAKDRVRSWRVMNDLAAVYNIK